MKFNVGQKVRVRSDLEYKEYNGGCVFLPEMEKYKGMIATITASTISFFWYSSRYRINICKHFYFSDDMLESVGVGEFVNFIRRLSNA